MQYRQEIDGLRALAVVPVILFHAGVAGFHGGFVGVDIFFVISGFLITTILLADFEAGTFSYGEFYERRIRRILPALFFVMLVCLPFAWFMMNPVELRQFLSSGRAVALFSSNIFFFLHTGYFDITSELNPLLHTWSLAVEEQWYLLFPILLTWMWKAGRKKLLMTLAVLFFVSLALAEWGATSHSSANFYLIQSRVWELLVGAFVSFYLAKVKSFEGPISQWASFGGFLLIAYSVFAFDQTTPFPSFYALVPTVGTALIILFAHRGTLIGKLLSRKLLVGIGLISYSAYLWHQPLFAFIRLAGLDGPDHLFIFLTIPFTFLLGFLSWKFIETPFRNRQFFKRKQLFSTAFLFSIFFVLLGALAYSVNVQTVGRLQNKKDGAYRFDFPLMRTQAGLITDLYMIPDLNGRFETKKTKILVIGDSMAHDFLAAAKRSSQIDKQFEFKYLIYDDLCFEPTYQSADCIKSRDDFSASPLPTQSQFIFILVGFHPDTNLEAFIEKYPSLRKKLVILSSSHFDHLYTFATKAKTVTPIDYRRLAELYANQKHATTVQGNIRAAEIALRHHIPYYDGYEIYCLERNFCPLINEKGEILIFDNAHKTVEGLDYYRERLEYWFSNRFKP